MKNMTATQEITKQARKAGQPPGTLIYTGKEKTAKPHIRIITYNSSAVLESEGSNLEKCLSITSKVEGITWINIEGLNDTALIKEVSAHYNLHPLTVENILNVGQRSKVEVFDGYIFITLNILSWHPTSHTFHTEPLSFVVGKNFLLSFQEKKSPFFNAIYQRLHAGSAQNLQQNDSDYLVYLLIDTVVDQYFVVLEGLGNAVEALEEKIITENPENPRQLHHLKHQILMLRKAIWPVREMISHLSQEQILISPFTRVYLRDVYDHVIQAIDIIETFWEMLEGLLSIYLSSMSNRMNEVMKILTVVATLFIPVTFLTGIFGMNFKYMPELNWRWSYYIVLGVMFLIALIMLYYFRRKKWV